ncbi:uncharacterized protein LOC122844262 isoform X2 [Gambusia affinis]|uniref:uncharacterized protein LOC122844262 isoform X2 n=1 Tax=Gambusia affinis TaxID=33528 RepID=UPI000F35DD60|nr:uncharacterized protein LOC122844262 isoform X2 [Gambusia affinis]
MAGPVWRAAATDTECLDRSQNQNQARCLRPPRPHRPAPPRQTGRTHPEGAAELGVGSVGSGSEPEPSAADIMATASTSGQSSFGLGKKKKSPGLMDQLSKLFGGEKKKRSKGSFRGHQAASPQQPSARRRTNENAVVHFFRSLVSSPPPKSTWREVLGLSHVGHVFTPGARWALMTQKRPFTHTLTVLTDGLFVSEQSSLLLFASIQSDSLLLDDFETAQLFMTRPPRRELRARSRRSGDAENKARCPGSSTWEKPSPVLPQNAGAPSSKLSADLHRSDPTGPEQHQAGEAEPQESDPQPQQMLTD